jgi:hypothetical protein
VASSASFFAFFAASFFLAFASSPLIPASFLAIFAFFLTSFSPFNWVVQLSTLAWRSFTAVPELASAYLAASYSASASASALAFNLASSFNLASKAFASAAFFALNFLCSSAALTAA